MLFCSILGGLVGLGYLLFDPIVKHIVLNKLILRNSSDFAEIWENPPITPHLKVITNRQTSKTFCLISRFCFRFTFTTSQTLKLCSKARPSRS